MSEKVTVDAQNLWYLLQRYGRTLDNECPSHLTLKEWREGGWCRSDYQMITDMENKIKEIM